MTPTQQALEALRGYRNLQKEMRSKGLPPHTDYWHQSIYEAEAKMDAAIAALEAAPTGAAQAEWSDAKLRGIASDYFPDAKDWPAAMLCLRHLLMEQAEYPAIATPPAEPGADVAEPCAETQNNKRTSYEPWKIIGVSLMDWHESTRDLSMAIARLENSVSSGGTTERMHCLCDVDVQVAMLIRNYGDSRAAAAVAADRAGRRPLTYQQIDVIFNRHNEAPTMSFRYYVARNLERAHGIRVGE